MPVVPPVVAVLDDEVEMRKAFRRLLSCRGYQVREYSCAEDLMGDLHDHRPGCLLLDLHMPGLNGFDVLEALQTQRLGIATVVITAHDEPGTQTKVLTLGAMAYLLKPVNRESLLAAVEAATRYPGKTQEGC
jgi:FixJ family two-component response regulator